MTDSATYTMAGGGSTLNITLSGTGTSTASASLSASPALVAFGNVTVGQTSGATTITIRNTGGAAATDVSFTSSNAAKFALAANTCGTSVAAGASCSVSVIYKPTAAAADNANLTVAYAGGTPVTVPLSGTGTSTASASLSASPTLVAFGNVTVGQTSGATTVTIRNTGSAAATGVNFANSNAARFPITANTCGASIGSGATCTFAVAFSPAAAGAEAATVTVTHAGGGTLAVSFSGWGVGTLPPGVGQLSFATAVTLPDTAVGATSALRIVTVTNIGSATVSVTGVTSSNAEFAVANNSCGSVVAGGACSFAITFSPGVAGVRSGVITVASDASGSPRRSLGAFGNGVGTVPPTAATAIAVEYYHQALDHYFITASQDEITKLDNGTFAGWARTGQLFNVYAAAAAGRETVCRFFSTAFGIKSSHFYTSDAGECAVVRSNASWQFEGGVLYATSPALNGACPTGMNPVYRVYNNGQGGAPNHRYTTDPEERARMLLLGWIAEGWGTMGVIMCAPN
jgi:hypothetical protein